ncbi:MAG: hypothetical protein R3D67_13500 [Hyphomicrobiaceae bacterium]
MVHTNGSVSLGLADGVEPGNLASRWLNKVGSLQIGTHVCADPVGQNKATDPRTEKSAQVAAPSSDAKGALPREPQGDDRSQYGRGQPRQRPSAHLRRNHPVFQGPLALIDDKT